MQWFDWSRLRNPIYQHSDWSVKDACIIAHGDRFTLFFSAFFDPGDGERSHIAAVTTQDLVRYSEPLFVRDGRAQGWSGLCSPNITALDSRYIVTYNSWGDQPGRPNQLFYAESRDLVAWDFDHPLAPDLTAGARAIDPAVTYHAGRYFLNWKERQTPQVAWATSLDGPWQRLGKPTGGTFENGQFITLDTHVHMVVTKRTHYPSRLALQPYLLAMRGDPQDPQSWLQWTRPRRMVIPREGFNTHHRANAGFLADWRRFDGYVYLLYAGNMETHSHAGRGHNRLGIARSWNLVNWGLPGS
jgi:hypothetical protein